MGWPSLLIDWLAFGWEKQFIILPVHFQDSALPSLDDTKLFRSAIDSLYDFLVSLNYSFQMPSDIGPAYLMRKATEYLVTFDFSKACSCVIVQCCMCHKSGNFHCHNIFVVAQGYEINLYNGSLTPTKYMYLYM